VIMARDIGDHRRDLVEQMTAIVQPGVKLLEMNLRDGDYWWSTRLYLLAALAHDMSDVDAFVFLRGGDDRRFVGLSSPSVVRRAFAAREPYLEMRYHEAAGTAPPMSAAAARVEQIVISWTLKDFGLQGDQPEGDFASRVSPTDLSADLGAIGSPLSTDSVDWPGYASRPTPNPRSPPGSPRRSNDRSAV
jgi:hypothetical protein